MENSGLSDEEKSEELNRSLSILKLQQKMESKTITEWEKEALATHLSLQKTKEELRATPLDTSAANLLDFTLLKLGNTTKTQISNKLNDKRNNSDITDAEIQEIEL